MGWGIYCNNDLYFHKPNFSNKYDVDGEIDDCKKAIDSCKQQLLIIAASDPKNLIEKDCEDNELSLVESIKITVNRVLVDLEENIINEYRYSILQENWHFTSGDFVNHDKYYKYTGETNIVFIKDTIYPVNLYKDGYPEKQKYAVLLPSWEYITLNQEQIDNNFIEVTKEEYDNRTNKL